MAERLVWLHGLDHLRRRPKTIDRFGVHRRWPSCRRHSRPRIKSGDRASHPGRALPVIQASVMSIARAWMAADAGSGDAREDLTAASSVKFSPTRVKFCQVVSRKSKDSFRGFGRFQGVAGDGDAESGEFQIFARAVVRRGPLLQPGTLRRRRGAAPVRPSARAADRPAPHGEQVRIPRRSGGSGSARAPPGGRSLQRNCRCAGGARRGPWRDGGVAGKETRGSRGFVST
jgi:hypothetical protein